MFIITTKKNNKKIKKRETKTIKSNNRDTNKKMSKTAKIYFYRKSIFFLVQHLFYQNLNFFLKNAKIKKQNLKNISQLTCAKINIILKSVQIQILLLKNFCFMKIKTIFSNSIYQIKKLKIFQNKIKKPGIFNGSSKLCD